MDELMKDDDVLMEKPTDEDTSFGFAVARIRAKENTLLSNQALENLMACRTYSDCVRFLLEKGWEGTENDAAEELIEKQQDETWALMRELCSEKEIHFFDIFRYRDDFHNMKAAIKEAYVQKENPNVYMDNGTIPIATIKKCAADGDFGALPYLMMKAGKEAYDVLFHTGDSQLCDVIIDKAALEAIYKAGKETGNDLLKGYVELRCGAANISIAVRSCKAKKDADFLKRAFVECDSISANRITEATRNSLEAIYDYLESTTYKDAIGYIKESPAAFERWCDNRMINVIRPQKYKSFGIGPLAAYVLAKQNEIKSVRIILSGKINNLSDEAVRERLRDMYV